MRMVGARAPGPVAAGNIVAQAQLDDPVGKAVPLARLAGEGIAQRTFLKQQPRFDLHALDAGRIEIDRRGPVDRAGARLGNVTDAFAIADRDHIDPVFDVAVHEEQLRRSPRPEPLVDLQFIAPILLRPQIGVASILVVVVQKGAREKIVEAQLQHTAPDLERHIEIGRRCPGDRQRSLRSEEAAGQAVHAALRDRRPFGARNDLHVQFVGDLAAKTQQAFVAILLHAAGTARERKLDEGPRRIERIKRRNIVERVERCLPRQLPIAAQHLPLIFAARDRLADIARLGEAIAHRRRSVRKAGDHFLRIGFMAEAPQPDQLQFSGADPELVIAVDFVIPAVRIFANGAIFLWGAVARPTSEFDIGIIDALIMGAQMAHRIGGAVPGQAP